MKHLNLNILTILFVLSASFLGCSTASQPTQTPSHKVVDVKKNEKKEDGYLQKKLDHWLTTEWEPNTQEVTQKYKEKEKGQKSFTLQKYVDKAVEYSHSHTCDENNTHYHYLESLPAIGK